MAWAIDEDDEEENEFAGANNGDNIRGRFSQRDCGFAMTVDDALPTMVKKLGRVSDATGH